MHTNSPNHRFAWLTPLQGQKSSTGPWVLCDNRTQHLENNDTPCVSITVNALLHLMAACFHPEELEERVDYPGLDHHASECGRFEIRKSRQDSCTSRLFVQQRTDYFQRLELYVDKQLVAAYHEPVWPHLQHPHQTASLRLTVPVACVDFFENLEQTQNAPYDMQNSANQAQRDDKTDGDKIVAA
ncbi:MAG: hypothetical protein AB8B64_23690 [Granulosicoccus sp.]